MSKLNKNNVDTIDNLLIKRQLLDKYDLLDWVFDPTDPFSIAIFGEYNLELFLRGIN